ncbi:MAG: hypothetical protein ABIP78_02110 [Pyrinomonadaceae bacterium]
MIPRPDGMLNKTPLRSSTSSATSDVIGMPIKGKITAEKSGNSVHASLMSKLLKAEHAWEIV